MAGPWEFLLSLLLLLLLLCVCSCDLFVVVALVGLHCGKSEEGSGGGGRGRRVDCRKKWRVNSDRPCRRGRGFQFVENEGN